MEAHDNAERFYKRVQIIYLFVQYQPLEWPYFYPALYLLQRQFIK
jgi:hypothetical protein